MNKSEAIANEEIQAIKTRFQFLPYQKKWIDDDSQFKIILKSRGIGISEASSYMAVRNCLKKNKNQLIVCKNSKDLSKIMKSCRMYAEVLSKINKYKTGKELKLNDASGSVEFLDSGKYIMGFSAHNPKSIRGFYGDIIWDEAAFARDEEELFDTMLYISLRGYSISVISTPLGNNDLFYQLWNDIDKYGDWNRHKIDIFEARKQGYHIPEKVFQTIVKNAGGLDSEIFRRECLCEFIDESTATFTWKLIKSCDDDANLDKIEADEYFIGVDIGRSKSLSAIVIVSKVKDIYYIKDIITIKKTDFKSQYEMINQAYEHYRPKYMKIDKGYNPQTAEDLCAKFYGAEGVHLGGPTKARLVNNVKNLMEKGLLKFNLKNNEIEALTKDMHAIRMKTNSNGITYESPMNERGHGDRFWALSLALMELDNVREFHFSFA